MRSSPALLAAMALVLAVWPGRDLPAQYVAPAVPGPEVAAIAADAAAAEAVALGTRPPTLWYFLGFEDMCTKSCGLIDHIGQKPLVQYACNSIFTPILQTMGLLPGTGPNDFPVAAGGAPLVGPGGVPLAPGPPSAPELAAKIAAEQSPANVAIKVKAIRFLAEADCLCYPEVIDALLASLDDCSEEVRYEALRALRRGCQHAGCTVCGGALSPTGGPNCKCQPRVLARVSGLLLDRDVSGRLKEKSYPVRQLARLILQECLCTTPLQPEGQPRVRPALPDPQFDVAPPPPAP